MENVSPGSLVAAEARVGDFALLPDLNKNKTRGMGSVMGVDSMVLLQSRAEKQFLGKAVHKAVVRREKKNAELRWSKVLEVSGGRGHREGRGRRGRRGGASAYGAPDLT
jgi:hypothetical protein